MRLSFAAALLSVLSLLACSEALSQQPPGQPPVLQPTTVQLPTFRVFTVQTTVSAPDSGGASLASLKRARDGSITRGAGPLRNRGLASGRDAGGASVHATIIDHREIDEALHAAAARRSGTPLDPARAEASRLSRHVTAEAPASLATIRAERAVAADSRSAERNTEAADYLAQGQRAEAAGNAGAARVFYQMASRRGDRQVQQQALDRLHALAADKDRTVAHR